MRALKSKVEIEETGEEAFAKHYEELTSRNFHFVPPELQEKLKNFKVFIAGCGSTGGACIEALARVGVCHFALADNGDYELNNLNRQHARLENIGQNKASFHGKEVKCINPFASVLTCTEGVTSRTVEELVEWADFVFDAVDVTTSEGIKAKVLLHEKCHKFKKPVLSGLDLGYLQWGCAFDYRFGHLDVLNGKDKGALKAKHPIAALMYIYPLKVVPSHCYKLLEDLLEEKVDFASQMGCTSDALSAVIVPAVLKYVETGVLIPDWSIDLSKYRYTFSERCRLWATNLPTRWKVRRLIKSFL